MANTQPKKLNELKAELPGFKPKSTAKNKVRFLMLLADLGNVAAAAKGTPIHRRTVYDWREADEVFAADWEDALEYGIDALEAEARKRALNSSDTLLIFLLKGARPETYRDRYTMDVNQKNSGPVEDAKAALLHKLKDLAEKAGGGTNGEDQG